MKTPVNFIGSCLTMFCQNMTKVKEAILENLAKNIDVRAGSFYKEGYTAQEMDIIKAVAEGLSNKEIVNRLFITESTVRNYYFNSGEGEFVTSYCIDSVLSDWVKAGLDI